MRGTTWSTGACLLAAAGLVLLGCTAPPTGVAGAETDPPAASAGTGPATGDPGQEETGSSGGPGGGSARLAPLPAGGAGTVDVVDGEGCAVVGGSSVDADVTVTVAEVRLAPEGSVLLPGSCGAAGGSPACAGLVWSGSFGGCRIRFAPAPGAATLEVQLLGSVVCEDPAECDKAYAQWGEAGTVPLEFDLAYPEPPTAGPDPSGSADPAPEPEPEPEPEPQESPTAGGG